ncbi:MAG: hypothetical protein IPJ19_12380 [Planctomycetes bacterium]|nr:hypothetical protein [Planctomycetota bacterium]
MIALMDISGSWLMTSMLVGTVGGGFFLYGKKQSRLPQMLTGLLIGADSFVSDPLWMCVGAGVVLVLLWGALRAGW